MKFHWLKHNNSPRLLLFFNGWGMDQHPVRFLASDARHDVLMFYDYRNFAIEPGLTSEIGQYQDKVVIAWSMGVWAYAQINAQYFNNIQHAIALNGTCRAIHESDGIPPAVYQMTVEQFSESGRTKFFKRLCGSGSLFKRFQPYQPQRALQEQHEELLAIQQLAVTSETGNVPYDVALIGTHDKIIPTKNQRNFWQGRIPYTLIDAPHFPFFLWNSWKEVIRYATKHQ